MYTLVFAAFVKLVDREFHNLCQQLAQLSCAVVQRNREAHRILQDDGTAWNCMEAHNLHSRCLLTQPEKLSSLWRWPVVSGLGVQRVFAGASRVLPGRLGIPHAHVRFCLIVIIRTGLNSLLSVYGTCCGFLVDIENQAKICW